MIGVSVALITLMGCSSLSYYWQAFNGQGEILAREQPISDLLQEPNLDPQLRARLELAQRARRFAVTALALPDNGSYTRYADLQRPFVVWNVVATPALSVTPRQWCYWIAGCFNYRGYFHKEDAHALAQTFQHQGDDVAIAGAWAYSTLGWFDDPLLNTMLEQDESGLVGTMFHELAHQTVYVDNDSSFNESFANAVEEEGLRRWYAQQGQAARYQAYLQRQQQRDEVVHMLVATREKLRLLYTGTLSAAQKRAQKQLYFSELKQEYQHWRDSHSDAGFDRFMQQDLNNAKLALVATYMDKVPVFLAMLAACHGDLPAFYREARRIGKLPLAQREAALANYVQPAS